MAVAVVEGMSGFHVMLNESRASAQSVRVLIGISRAGLRKQKISKRAFDYSSIDRKRMRKRYNVKMFRIVYEKYKIRASSQR